MKYGLDVLAGVRYQQLILDHFPANWGIGIFSNTFGDAYPLLDKLLAKGHTPFVRLQLLWSDTHSFSPADFPTIVHEAQRFVPLMHKYPHVDWYLSGACEHGLGPIDAAKLATLVEQAAPQARYINTPLPTGAIVPGTITEGHGGGMPRHLPYSFSYDGSGAEDSDVETIKENFAFGEYFLFWTYRLNGHYNAHDTSDRQHRDGWPDVDVFNRLTYLHNNKGRTMLPDNWLYKSVGEESKTDPKSGHPVFIIPVHASHVELHAHGKLVHSFPNFNDNYTDGRARYYGDGTPGYKLAKAYGLCDVVVDGTKYGVIDPGFRQGITK